MTTLTWFDLSKLPEGTRVKFATTHDIYPYCIVPEGTAATITENGLNEIWCALMVLPDDEEVRASLKEWDGNVVMNPKNDGEEMHSLSPLALA